MQKRLVSLSLIRIGVFSILIITNSNTYLDFPKCCKKKGIQIVYYTLPTNKVTSFFSKQYLIDYEKELEEIKHRFILLDGTPLITLDSLDFRNSDHLNTLGASIVSKTILNGIIANQKLRSFFSLPDTILSIRE